MAGIVLQTAPTEEPVTLSEVKAHLRVDIADDDALITALIVAARQYAEMVLRRAIVTQTWRQYLDDFPAYRHIDLYRPRIQSVAYLKTHDVTGATATMSTSRYEVDTAREPGRIVLAYGEIWPNVVLRSVNGVEIEFTSGYGDASAVPESVKLAIKTLIGHYYENRETVISQTGVTINPAVVPFATRALLDTERVYEIV